MTTTKLKPPYAISKHSADKSEFQLCIQCLSAYNQGIHHFYWVDLFDIETLDDFKECIDYTINTSPVCDAEEWFYSDSMGLEGKAKGEYANLSDIKEYIDVIKQLPEDSREAYKAYSDYEGLDEIISLEKFEEKFRGFYDSTKECAESFYEDTTPEESKGILWDQVDWERVWYSELRHQFLEIETVGKGLAIFWRD